MTEYSDYYGIFTHINFLMYWKAEWHTNWLHREMSVKRDPFLHKYVCELDADIFQELPIFVPDILGSDKSVKTPEEEELKFNGVVDNVVDKPSEKNEALLQEWIHENWTDLFIRMFDAARTHITCIVQLYDTPPYWRVFGPRQIQQIKYNDNDEPISAEIQWCKRLPFASTAIVHNETLNFLPEEEWILDENNEYKSRAILVNFRSDLDKDISSTDIEHIWDIDIILRYIQLDIANNSAKSSGFMWCKWGAQADDEKIRQVEAMFEKANSSRGVGATENVIQDMKAMYMVNPEFPIEALDKFLKLFSGACDMPFLYFNSEKETGGVFEENSSAMAQINHKKRAIFGRFKKYILQLVEMRWGIKCDDVFPNIEEVEKEQYHEDIIEPRAQASDGSAKEIKKMRLQA